MLPKYEKVTKRPNVLKNRNPLKHTKAKVVPLESRVADLESSNEWKKLVKSYKGKVVSPLLRPKVKMVKLGAILIDEDIQRQLDVSHCSKRIANVDLFDPRLLQVVYCIKPPGKEEYHAVDGQHTATTLAAMINSGLFENETDWKNVEVAILYIETTSKAFARKAFALINGKGKKKISKWYEHRTKVMSVRIDKSTDEEDVDAERKQTICEKYDCYPIDEDDTAFKDKPGTFTHMQAFSLSDRVLEIACKFHDAYFHYDAIDGSLWFMMNDLVRSFDAAKIDITDSFLKELAAILQQYFAGLYQFHQSVKGAHHRWGIHTHGYEIPWEDDSIAATLVQLYQKLGGKQKIPTPLTYRFSDIVDFLEDDIKELYEGNA